MKKIILVSLASCLFMFLCSAVAYEQIRDERVPDFLTVDTFVIGTSHSGALGTYRVERTVSVR